MTAAWHRLAFVTACAGFVLGLVLVAEWQAWWVAVIVGQVGVALGVVLAQSWDDVRSGDRPRRPPAATRDPGSLPLPPSPRKRAEPTYDGSDVGANSEFR